jgi:hypothetical protein
VRFLNQKEIPGYLPPQVFRDKPEPICRPN